MIPIHPSTLPHIHPPTHPPWQAKVLQGIIKKDHDMEPDMISAPGMAREAKIESIIVEDGLINNHQYLNLVSVQVSLDCSVHMITLIRYLIFSFNVLCC